MTPAALNRRINIAGQRFGFWTVELAAGISNGSRLQWWCVCDCGARRIVSGYRLRAGKSKSCGCQKGALTGAAIAVHGQRLSGPRRIERVHRLVAQAFCPNPDGKPFINHIDNDRANNCASNLEWCTQAENLKHMTDQGRRAAPWKGKRSPSARLEDDAVLAIRAEYAAGGTSWDRLAKKWKVSKRVVGRLLNKETYVDV